MIMLTHTHTTTTPSHTMAMCGRDWAGGSFQGKNPSIDPMLLLSHVPQVDEALHGNVISVRLAIDAAFLGILALGRQLKDVRRDLGDEIPIAGRVLHFVGRGVHRGDLGESTGALGHVYGGVDARVSRIRDVPKVKVLLAHNHLAAILGVWRKVRAGQSTANHCRLTGALGAMVDVPSLSKVIIGDSRDGKVKVFSCIPLDI